MTDRSKAWGGFMDGKLAYMEIDDGWGGWGPPHIMVPAVFKTRRDARGRFEDVRPVSISCIKRKRP